MNLEIINKSENPLLGRTEVDFQLTNKTTPSRTELKGLLAKSLKAKEDLIIIDIVDQKTGSNVILGTAKVYKDQKTLAAVGLEYKKKRTKEEVKEEQQSAPAESSPQPDEGVASAPVEEGPSKEPEAAPAEAEKSE